MSELAPCGGIGLGKAIVAMLANGDVRDVPSALGRERAVHVCRELGYMTQKNCSQQEVIFDRGRSSVADCKMTSKIDSALV